MGWYTEVYSWGKEMLAMRHVTIFNLLIYSGEQEKDECGKLCDTQGV